MNDIIVSLAVFHTLSAFGLMAGCAIASLAPPPRRPRAQVWVDQMELEADSILSTPVSTPVAYPRADVETATPAAA